MIGYGSTRLTSHRYDSTATSFLDGTRTGSILFGSLTVSYDQKKGAFKYATYARADASYTKLNAFTENGDANYSLAFDKMSAASQSTAIGFRGQIDFAKSWGIISPLARIEYNHIFNGKFLQNISYTNDAGTIYTLSQNESHSSLFNTEVGLRISNTSQIASTLSYINSFNAFGILSQGVKGSLQLRF